MKNNYLLTIICWAFAFVSIAQNPSTSFAEIENFGGKAELKRLLKQEIYFPKSERENKEKITLKVCVMLSEKASINDIKTDGSKNAEIIEEAKKLAKLIVFQPRVVEGKYASGQFCFDVEFDFKKYQKIVKERGYDDTEDLFKDENDFLIFHKNETDTGALPFLDKDYDNLNEFINRNLKYPSAALQNNIGGKVELQFVVEKSGRITNIKELKSVGSGCSNEAVRLLKMLKWKAAVKSGKKVRSFQTFMVNFSLGGARGNPSATQSGNYQ
jgi:TonB family protein